MPEQNLPRIRYEDFSKHLHEEVIKQNVPSDGMIEVTHRCNFRCVHCYVPRDSMKPELSTEEFQDIVDIIAEEGCIWLTFTGGEPFVRRDFLDIYMHAKKRGLLLAVFTNGSLITPKIADQLRDWPPFRISMSIYGATRETYRNITGSGILYDLSMRAIELLMDRGIRLELKTVVMTLNKQELGEMKSFAESLGVDFRYTTFINAGLDGSKGPCDLRVPPEEIVALDIADTEQIEALRELYRKSLQRAPVGDNLINCGAGLNTFVIDPYGELVPCLALRKDSYSLRGGDLQERFRQGFHEFFPKIRSRKVQKYTKCVKCQIIDLCDQCPGHAQLEVGDAEAPIEYACKVAQLRFQELKKH